MSDLFSFLLALAIASACSYLLGRYFDHINTAAQRLWEKIKGRR
ncbi:hypothetical protein ACIBQ1_09985 [Nonomuraea sp. NPDC050153]